MALKDILNTYKREDNSPLGYLTPQLDRYLISLDGNRLKGKPENRAQDCWHPSSVSTVECLRLLVYLWLKTDPSNPQRVNERGRLIFDVGHHIGYMFQQYFWDMDILEGVYHCVNCKHEWWAVSPRECPSCKAELEIWYNLQYKEVPIINEKRNIIGHADGIARQKDGSRRMLEFKSIKNRDFQTPETTLTFNELVTAKREHVFQTQLYMDSDTMKKLGVKSTSIIYLAKNTQEKREFVVSAMQEMVKPMYNKMDAVELALEEEFLPDRIGPKNCADCRYCPMRDYCHDVPHTFQDADMRNKNGVA